MVKGGTIYSPLKYFFQLSQTHNPHSNGLNQPINATKIGGKFSIKDKVRVYAGKEWGCSAITQDQEMFPNYNQFTIANGF